MDEGWVTIHRTLTDSDLWLKEPFTKGQAWVDLIANANYKDGTFWVRGIEVEVKRGQLGWSQLTMAKRWKWSREKVNNFLNWLEKHDKITRKTIQQITTVITLVNYDYYQPNPTTNPTTNRQQTDNRPYTNKESNKGKRNTITATKGKTTIDPTVKKEVDEVLAYYNTTHNANALAYIDWYKNFLFWRQFYSLEQIKEAVAETKNKEWWGVMGGMKLKDLFRQKNTKGEDCDRIGEMLENARKGIPKHILNQRRMTQ